jgi:hypothetical protein
MPRSSLTGRSSWTMASARYDGIVKYNSQWEIDHEIQI